MEVDFNELAKNTEFITPPKDGGRYLFKELTGIEVHDLGRGVARGGSKVAYTSETGSHMVKLMELKWQSEYFSRIQDAQEHMVLAIRRELAIEDFLVA